jgi:CRISPR-associated endonuclease/helicase Cas3
LDVLNRKLRQHLETLQKPVNTHFPDINKHRADILRHCLDAAERQQGLFLLTVPTGGGKTLSSLAFALKHALKNGLKRVIYVIPYTSIIEQNAAVFRKVLGDEAVLEHHSNFEPKQEDRRSRLASENWDAPVIVTTNVQFFESLFRRKSSRCRKIHNIAKSVVILDEAQMLPVPLLLPCLEVLKALSSAYGTTVVLCTATQPALKEREDFRHGLKHVSEIVPDPDKLYNCKEFKRVHVKNLGKISDDELAEKLKRQDKVLCILNTRKYARLLYEKMGKQEGICHLSALMCPAHRTEKFEEIRNRLDNEETPCRVISTQLIEAGVDIDFPTVFRSLAGIDSIAQAAGRCNREGKLPEGGHLYIFSSESDVHPEFRQNAEIAEMVMREHEDILSLEAIKAYFQNLFWLKGESRLDEQQILKALNEGFSGFNFPFEETDRNFKIIKNDTFPVIIPYNDKARELIQQLRHSDYPVSIARKLQRFTVQVYSDEFSRLLRLNSLESLHNQQYHILSNMSLYRDDLGLALDK